MLAFICDQILAKFQCSLPFLAEYAKLTVPKKEFCDFVEELVLKNNFFGFDYLTEKNTNINKKKLFGFIEVESTNIETYRVWRHLLADDGRGRCLQYEL